MTWQSHVENKDYSVTYFNRIAAFKRRIAELQVKAGLIRATHLQSTYMSRALNGSSAIQCFKCSDAIEICNKIILNFYMGLPHIYISGLKLHGYKLVHKHFKLCVTLVLSYTVQ